MFSLLREYMLTTASVDRTIAVPLYRAWSLLSDFTGSPSPVFPVTVHEKGDADYNGVGTVRTIKLGPFSVMERLEAVEPNRSYMYCILAGAPIKQYLGKFEFSAADGATRIRWHADFKPIIPFSGWAIAIVIRRMVHKMLSQMEADRR